METDIIGTEARCLRQIAATVTSALLLCLLE